MLGFCREQRVHTHVINHSEEHHMSTLTPTQIEVLTAAADRPNGSIHPLPARLPSGAKNKVVASLLARGLVFDGKDSLEYRLTAEGYAAVGRECERRRPLRQTRNRGRRRRRRGRMGARLRRAGSAAGRRRAQAANPRDQQAGGSGRHAPAARGRNNCANLRIYRLASPHGAAPSPAPSRRNSG
jgi:hypothetical protein